MAKITSRYTKDREGNWKMVPADYEHPIPCKVCDRGTLERNTKYRLAGPAVVIGYILLVPSVIGMLCALALSAFVLAKSTRSSAITGFVGFTLIASLVGGLLGWLLVMKKRVLQCSTCRAVVNAS
jgi:hypothetical protein